MRGSDKRSGDLFSYVDLPKDEAMRQFAPAPINKIASVGTLLLCLTAISPASADDPGQAAQMSAEDQQLLEVARKHFASNTAAIIGRGYRPFVLGDGMYGNIDAVDCPNHSENGRLSCLVGLKIDLGRGGSLVLNLESDNVTTRLRYDDPSNNGRLSNTDFVVILISHRENYKSDRFWTTVAKCHEVECVFSEYNTSVILSYASKIKAENKSYDWVMWLYTVKFNGEVDHTAMLNSDRFLEMKRKLDDIVKHIDDHVTSIDELRRIIKTSDESEWKSNEFLFKKKCLNAIDDWIPRDATSWTIIRNWNQGREPDDRSYCSRVKIMFPNPNAATLVDFVCRIGADWRPVSQAPDQNGVCKAPD